jgi:NAD(P)-dependent dehydrogenase (short-subunit alcohol dehydrogenase family)
MTENKIQSPKIQNLKVQKTSELFDVGGKVAIVTGASSGLGVTFAETLAEFGAKVVVSARRMEKLNDVVTRIEDAGGTASPFQCDVSKEDDMIALIQHCVKTYGGLDIMVNNAGVASMSPAVDMTLEEWNKVLSVNLTGVFLGARHAAKEMIKENRKWGKIINISSIYGVVGDVFPASPYYATKAAVINLTRDLAVEWAPHKINVNAIAPGFFPSEMTEGIFKDPTYFGYITNQTPLGRVGEPRDLKGVLLFLCSRSSDYITGQTIFVDGGWTIW